jgi:hypothetical protein
MAKRMVWTISQKILSVLAVIILPLGTTAINMLIHYWLHFYFWQNYIFLFDLWASGELYDLISWLTYWMIKAYQINQYMGN